MRNMVEKILKTHGTDMTVVRGAERFTVRGFFQPVTGKGENMGRITLSPLGRVDRGQYVYIGPLEPALAPGDELEDCIVRRSEPVSGCYVWAMCVKKGGGEA